MVQFGKKKTLSSYLYTRPVILILLVVIVLMLVSVYERYKIEREMAERRINVEEEQQELLLRKEEIKAKVDYLEGERGIEEEVRKHFDVAKEGEQVVILLGEDEVEQEIEQVPEPESKWYQFWQ